MTVSKCANCERPTGGWDALILVTEAWVDREGKGFAMEQTVVCSPLCLLGWAASLCADLAELRATAARNGGEAPP
jgi:hypothetical protein